MGIQSDWRWCRNCRVLFYSKLASKCPVNGGHHDGSASGAYTAYHDLRPADRLQQGWRWCRKCQSIFFAHGRAQSGVCPNGGPHDAAGSGAYSLLVDADVNAGYAWMFQGDWRWCSKCDSLFHGSGSGLCPAGGGGHRDGSGGDYKLLVAASTPPPGLSGLSLINVIASAQAIDVAYNSIVTPAPQLGGEAVGRIVQADWRRCRTCQGLFFSKNPSPCPGGPAHDFVGSKPYFLYHGITGDALQERWRWCNKCQGVFHGDGVDAGGACPAGGPHDGTNSGAYALLHATSERPEYQGAFEHRWRWCSKCQGLFNNDSGHGLCPVGGPHVDGTGIDYQVLCKSDVSVAAATVAQAAALDVNRAAVLALASVLSVPVRMGAYDWARSWSLPEAGRGVITFTAHAQNDVHIVLSTLANGAGVKYEVVVGGWANGRSVIRRGTQGAEIAAADVGLVAPGKANSIWVAVDRSTRKITVGRGPVGKGVILSAVDPNLPALKHFTFGSWNTPIQYSNIATGPLTEVALPALSAAYDWSRAWSLPEPGWGFITFDARATNDAILAISTQPGGAGEKYEIIIGGWVNNKSVIRRGIGGPELASAAVGLASPTEPNSLWVGLDRSTGKIQVGRGSPGQGAFLSYTDPAFLAAAQHFTFTSWNVPVEYTAIATRGPADVLTVPARTGAYDWGRVWSLPEPGRGVVTFTARTSNDVHIAFSTLPDGGGDRYEIVVGGWANGRSVIRRGSGGGSPELAVADTGLKSPGAANPLWVSLDRTRGRVEVGRGAPGEDVILAATDPAFHVGARHFTFSSWNVPIAYSDISARNVPDVARVEAQCKLIVDYDSNKNPIQRFQTVLVPRRADGSTMPGAKLRLYACEPVAIEREVNGALVTTQVGAGAPVELVTSMTGRCRFTVAPLPGRLTVPLMMVQSDAMAAGQWSVFSPDRDLHQKLSKVTGEQLTSTPRGKSGPLIDVRPRTYATAQEQINAMYAELNASLAWAVAMMRWNGDPRTMPKRPEQRLTQADVDALAGAVSQVMQVCAEEELASGDGLVSFSGGAEAEASVLAAAHPGRPTSDQSGEVLPVFEIDPTAALKRTIRRPRPAPAPPVRPARRVRAVDLTTLAAATDPATDPAADPTAGADPAIDPTNLSFSFWNDIGDAFENAADTVTRGAADLAGDAIDGATGVVRSAAEVAAQVARTANEAIRVSTGAIGTAAQFMNTMGASAQVLIRNADAAILQPAAEFSSNVMSGAQQLAIDTANGIVVIALIAKNGTYELVKTVIEEVEQAALVVGAFFEQVGLQIKMVIEFLCMLFDWGDILRTQGHIMQVLDEYMTPAKFRAIVEGQRTRLGGVFQAARAQLTALAAPGSGGGGSLPRLPNILDDIPSFGGPFGWLLDKLEGHIPTVGAGGLNLPSMNFTPDVQAAINAFYGRLMASPLGALLSDPAALINRNPNELLALVVPFAEEGIQVLASVADGLLGASVGVVSAIMGVLRERIDIPVVTDLIEWLVFDNSQDLSLLSLLTLLAAALLTILYKTTLDTGDAPFDAYESAVSFSPDEEPDPRKDHLWRGNVALMIFGSICGLGQIIFGGLALYTGDKHMSVTSAVFGLIGPLPSIPVSIAAENHFHNEQWANWSLNTVASIAQLVDAATGGSHKEPGVLSTICGMIMLGFAVNAHKGHTPEDDKRAAFDLIGQLLAVVTNMASSLARDPKTQGGIGLVSGTGAFALGIGSLVDTFQRPNAGLG